MMRSRTASVLGLGFGLCLASAADSQSPKWDLVCRYGNGSIAFMLNYAQHKSSGDMVSDQLAVSDGQIKFDVSATRTTLLQDFHVLIDRTSLKWTTDKPGWGGACQKP